MSRHYVLTYRLVMYLGLAPLQWRVEPHELLGGKQLLQFPVRPHIHGAEMGLATAKLARSTPRTGGINICGDQQPQRTVDL
jgi:hypothetical protein